MFFTAMGCIHIMSRFLPRHFVLWVDKQKNPITEPETAVSLRLKDKGHSFEDSYVKVARKDRWYKGRGKRSHLFRDRKTISEQRGRPKE